MKCLSATLKSFVVSCVKPINYPFSSIHREKIMSLQNDYFVIAHGWCKGRRAIICDTISRSPEGAISKFLEACVDLEWPKAQRRGFDVAPLELEIVSTGVTEAATGCSVDERSTGPA